MAIIAVAGDVSKGYADFCFRNEAGSDLPVGGCYDDTPAGHDRMRQVMARLASQNTDVQFIVGVESTGGLENNWIKLFRELGLPVHVQRLNPLAVRRFLERDLHRNITDELSAKGIAEYLLCHRRPEGIPCDEQMEAQRGLLRHTFGCIERGAEVRAKLQSHLPSVHPGLIAACRHGMPEWVLHLLVRYPTVSQLGAGTVEEVASIAYITEGRAKKLIAAAQGSVASRRDELTGQVVGDLAQEALGLKRKVNDLKKQLWQAIKDDEEVRILKSIPGIGRWTATVLHLEMGPFHRFHSEGAVVAYAGLDSRIEKSGDGEKHRHISRHGKSQIRACLQMPVLTALRMRCQAITQFYERLTKENGKAHQLAVTACMGKLLRIAYACVVSGQLFDETRHEDVRKRYEELLRAKAAADVARAATPLAAGLADALALDAPVTKREAKRRRAAAEALAQAAREAAGLAEDTLAASM